jgi:hypothetical protein
VKVARVGAGPADTYLSILLKLRDPAHDITISELGANKAFEAFGFFFAPAPAGRRPVAGQRQETV